LIAAFQPDVAALGEWAACGGAVLRNRCTGKAGHQRHHQHDSGKNSDKNLGK
jgi:hypothetical protein